MTTQSSPPKPTITPPPTTAATTTATITPSPATIHRASRTRSHISAKYELLLHQTTILQQPYNPLAVIRFRREVWQAAVREKAPMSDIRKVRMLKGGWDVGNEEMKDYLQVIEKRGAVSPQIQQQQFQQESGGSLLERKSGASLLGKKGSVFGKWKESLTRNSGASKQSQEIQQYVQPTSSSPPTASNILSQSLPLETFPQDSNNTATMGRRPSSSESPHHLVQLGAKQSTQKVLRRLRSGTVALNVMLGKGVYRAGGANVGASANVGPVSGHHKPSMETNQTESPVAVVQESALLNKFLGGGLSAAYAASNDTGQDNDGGEYEGEDVRQQLDGNSMDIIDQPAEQGQESNDQAERQSIPIERVTPAPLEDDPQSTRISRTRNRFKPSRNILRSPDRQNLMTTVAGDIERWIGNVGGFSNNLEDGGGGGEFVGQLELDDNDGVEKPRRQPRKMRLGRRRKEEEAGVLVNEGGTAPVDSLAAVGSVAVSREGKRRKEKKSRRSAVKGFDGHVVDQEDGIVSNTLFRLPRLKVKADLGSLDQPAADADGDVVKKTKKIFGGSLLSKEEYQIIDRIASPTTERKKPRRIMRLGKDMKIPDDSSDNTPTGRGTSPILIRRKSSKKLRRKSSLGQPLNDPSRVFDSPSEFTSSAHPAKDTETSSDIITTAKTDASSMQSIKLEVIVDDLETQIVDVANSVVRLLRLVLEKCGKERDELVETIAPYIDIIATFQIIPNPKPLHPINLKELSSSTDHLTSTLISPKFITHEAQHQNLSSNLEKMISSISSQSKALENGDSTIQAMILEMEKLGTDINERGSRRVKVLEDHIQHEVALKRGPMHAVMEVVYQCVEIMLIVIGYVIWLVYKGIKFVEQSYGMVIGVPIVKESHNYDEDSVTTVTAEQE
ncbi:UNVERIFIED_CONTAM: hypothetical protein HDU68_011822 [Siphonaria sp. JEL0065]|nr:hypothetical protein HDU68_011822 [Siphonaria sp. JEL0065]